MNRLHHARVTVTTNAAITAKYYWSPSLIMKRVIMTLGIKHSRVEFMNLAMCCYKLFATHGGLKKRVSAW